MKPLHSNLSSAPCQIAFHRASQGTRSISELPMSPPNRVSVASRRAGIDPLPIDGQGLVDAS